MIKLSQGLSVNNKTMNTQLSIKKAEDLNSFLLFAFAFYCLPFCDIANFTFSVNLLFSVVKTRK
ncbi:hypothetical protein RU96_GL002001 [Enterococcus canintestini]|uniref:Uncharacterized protein n=1 Tax=Enterococcus canintestini TaxID=317010 RepID=A0A1L8R7J8_9ENTE|nr:hypothetical protein RU96_GL002001 [Enterococcus canintestini]